MHEVPPASDVERVEQFCLTRVPATLHNEVRLDVVVDNGGIEIHEARPVLLGAPAGWTTMPVARFAYEPDGTYTLYSGNSDGTWDYYLDLEHNQILEVLLDEVDYDPTSVFWG
jgi:Protein of unknown function (DUF3024)